jgi:hypothetical protein
MIELKGSQVKTKLQEMTIAEYQAVVFKISDDKEVNKYAKWLAILKILGASNETLNTVKISEVEKFVNELNKGLDDVKDLPPLENFEHKGRNYVGSLDELTAKDVSQMVDLANKHPQRWISFALAVLFKDDRLGYNEHYTPAHISLKEKIISELNALDFYANIVKITAEIMGEYESEREATNADEILKEVENATTKKLD